MGDLFQWSRLFQNFRIIIPFITVTFRIVVYATVFGLIIALALALVRIKKIPVLYQISNLYISFMRGTPMLLQLLLVYYGLPIILEPVVHIDVTRVWDSIIFAYVTFSFNQGAFLSSIIYSAVKAVSIGQFEAGYSVGLTWWQTFRRIIVPQAVRIALPPFGSDLVGLFQNASLVFSIGVIDVMGRAKTIGTSSGHVFEAYLDVAVIFILCSLIIRGISSCCNKKLDYSAGKEVRE
ncbi:amino acid ABC transporter permease [Novisyntrophococcus fermenticellae]|uniref:amino acid ABC transporter permease n=1 Tax=Novisyntrophococcus fermenticellae TaxID=2068655 RepID=UPI001E48308B|nr:amino acid ABC transporter permease [Novisyntrophococcus fermenticellae]